MKVETREPYSQEACLHDLGRIGFSARPGRRTPGSSHRVSGCDYALSFEGNVL